MVKETRRFGKTKLYTLNAENDVVQKLLKLESTLIKYAMEAAADKHKEGQAIQA